MHKVKCKCCNQTFDRDTVPCVKEGNRYSHKECYEKRTEAEQKEASDKTALDNYIIKLFKLDYVTPRIQKQIKQYVEQYNYSYSGIHKALVYFYEVKGNSIEKANKHNKNIELFKKIYFKELIFEFNLYVNIINTTDNKIKIELTDNK